MKKTLSISILFSILFLGCSANNSEKVVRIDPREMRDTDANYGVEDLHIFIKSMIQSMLASNVFEQRTPSLVLSEIGMGKGIAEHIDTKLIANSIRTNLIKTTKVHFIDKHQHENLKDNAPQNINYILSGDIHAIKKDTSHTVDNFYMLNLKLTDTKTFKVLWTEDKEIRKILSK